MTGWSGDGRKTFLRFPLSQEEMLANAKSRLPTPIGLMLFLVLFIAFVSGTAFIQMGSEVSGIAIYIVAAVVSVLLYVGWRKTARE